MSVQATAIDARLEAQLEADRLYAAMQSEVGDLARRSTTMADVATVATRVHLLRVHRPQTVDVLASADLDGGAFVEHGFATADGFIGTVPSRVVCAHHHDLTDWPCPEVAAAFRTRLVAQPAHA